jgi:hypothetical protein
VEAHSDDSKFDLIVIKAARMFGTWQPIATASKDGRRLTLR